MSYIILCHTADFHYNDGEFIIDVRFQHLMEDKEVEMTVLFIDDNTEILKVFNLFFSKLEINVLSESDPMKGISQFKQFQDEINIVITDHSMEGMNGIEVSETIKSIKDVPTILLTGNTSVIPPIAEIPSIDMVLAKPINFNDLHEIMMKLL